jgi:hypothetical protein
VLAEGCCFGSCSDCLSRQLFVAQHRGVCLAVAATLLQPSSVLLWCPHPDRRVVLRAPELLMLTWAPLLHKQAD